MLGARGYCLLHLHPPLAAVLLEPTLLGSLALNKHS
jgi:hypothetical protein